MSDAINYDYTGFWAEQLDAFQNVIDQRDEVLFRNCMALMRLDEADAQCQCPSGRCLRHDLEDFLRGVA